VIDEVAGSMIAVAGLSVSPGIGIAGFVLFRFFDIVKPPPIYQIQALPGGWGVMVDDVFAGIAANVVLRLGLVAWPDLAGRIS
jgi:phosphatidylglycerophosphatase A